MKDRIIIDNVAPEGIGNDLKGCYFAPTSGNTYDFYDKDGNVKATGLNDHSTFSFDLDGVPGVEWTLSIKRITPTRVEGNWVDSPKTVGEPEGTYQGQAGGGFDIESAASAGS